MKIYIIGKYSGLDHQVAVDKFAETERQLIQAGISPENIVNPMKLGLHKNTPWDEAMKVCVKEMNKCNAAFIQKDWKTSLGARKEITIADKNPNGYALFWEDRNDIKRISVLIELGT